MAVFNGATTNFSHETTAYSLGIDYEFRISDLIGVGLLGEFIATDLEELIIGIPVFIHPARGFKLVAAPLIISKDMIYCGNCK